MSTSQIRTAILENSVVSLSISLPRQTVWASHRQAGWYGEAAVWRVQGHGKQQRAGSTALGKGEWPAMPHGEKSARKCEGCLSGRGKGRVPPKKGVFGGLPSHCRGRDRSIWGVLILRRLRHPVVRNLGNCRRTGKMFLFVPAVHSWLSGHMHWGSAMQCSVFLPTSFTQN